MMAAHKATSLMILSSGPMNHSGTALSQPLRIIANTGQITQVRNHVKIYPWRFNRNNRECYLDPAKTPYTDRFNINEFTYKRKRKDWQKVIPKDKDNRFNAYTWNDSYKSDPKEAKETAMGKLNRFSDSLRDRGSARESKPYNPPVDVQDKVLSIFKSSQLTSDAVSGKQQQQQGKEVVDKNDESLLALDLNQSKELKFNLISGCIKYFAHDMPSSYLNEMNTISDVVEYFSTPVRGVNPYTSMLRKDDSLPVNLSLLSEPMRYNRESDQFFKGYTALPGIISKVPGLRASKKYPIYNQDEFQWPDV